MPTFKSFYPVKRQGLIAFPGGFSSARSQRVVAPVAAVLLILLVQEFLSRTGIIDPLRFPPASLVLATLVSEIVTGRAWTPVSRTLLTWFVALSLSFVSALCVGILIGMNRTVRSLFSVCIEFLRPIPSTALIPLVILTLGANMKGAIFLTWFGTVWQILPMIVRGISTIEPVSHDTARVFGFSSWQRLLWLTIPSMESYLLTGLRIGAAAALVLLIGMELLTGITGVGRDISLAYAGSNLRLMYAYVLISGLLGAGVNLLLSRAIDWRARYIGGTVK